MKSLYKQLKNCEIAEMLFWNNAIFLLWNHLFRKSSSGLIF